MGALLFPYLFIKRSRSISWNFVVGTVLSLLFSAVFLPVARVGRVALEKPQIVQPAYGVVVYACENRYRMHEMNERERKRETERAIEGGQAFFFLDARYFTSHVRTYDPSVSGGNVQLFIAWDFITENSYVDCAQKVD
jgi:hypothetical protein